jgi:hypothetical protein
MGVLTLRERMPTTTLLGCEYRVGIEEHGHQPIALRSHEAQHARTPLDPSVVVVMKNLHREPARCLYSYTIARIDAWTEEVTASASWFYAH